MAHLFRQIRRLAKELKYQPLELLWNYPITINSLSTLERDIRRDLGRIVPAECRLLTSTETMVGMLAKYDFLDLTIRVPAALLLQSDYQYGVSLLRQLLPQNQNDAEDEAIFDEDELEGEEDLNFSKMFIEGLVEDLDADLTVCRMWLEARSPRRFEERLERKQFISTLVLPDNYFPHRFVIRDACLTNAEGVWFCKHFYL